MKSRIAIANREEISSIPTYYDIKYAGSSQIFEAEDVRGSTPEQLQEAEKVYQQIIEKLEAGEDIDEGLLGGLAGAGLGALAGPAIGKALCSVLGVDPKGTLGKLLTSRLVTTAFGFELAK
jgi:outer membrane lipoprotein SlyB